MKYDLSRRELIYGVMNISNENIFLKTVNSVAKNLLLETIDSGHSVSRIGRFLLPWYFLDTLRALLYPENIDERLQYGTI